MMSNSILGKNFAARARWSLLVALAITTPLARAQSVREVPTSNRVAGTVTAGYNTDFGPATSTSLSHPSYTVFDSVGNQYISDTGNNCVRKVDTNGSITVVAGLEQTSSPSDTCNAAGMTIPASQGLQAPAGLAVDVIGDLFIADSGHNCVRELPAGSVGSRALQNVVDTCTNSTIASVSPTPTALLLDAANNLGIAIADTTDGISQVIQHTQSAAPTSVCLLAGLPSAAVPTSCTGISGGLVPLSNPAGLAVDPVGNRFIADTGNACIREISTSGAVSTFLGHCPSDVAPTTPIPNFSPAGILFGSEGYLYISNAANATVLQYRGNGSSLLIHAGVVNGQGTPYSGVQEGIAATDVFLNNPLGLSVDSIGNVYVADTGNGIVRQLALGTLFPPTVLHNSGTPQTLQFEIDQAVNLVVTTAPEFPIFSGNNTCVGRLNPSQTAKPTTCKVTISFTPTAPGQRRSPLTLTDSSTATPTVYRFGSSGVGLGANALFTPGQIHTVASPLQAPTSVAVSTTGDVYFSQEGTGPGAGTIQMVPAGSQTPKVLVPAGGLLQAPAGLGLDSAQNLYVADSVANAIFSVDANGVVKSVATGLNDPIAVVVDLHGNLLVAENGSGAVNVLKIYAGGQQTIVAGQGSNTAPDNVPASTARFTQLGGLYQDANGALYVSDQGALRVYNIDLFGTIHFYAGNGTTTTTNPLVATQTALLGPAGITGDAANDIFIADGSGNRIEVVFGGANQNPGILQLAGTGVAGSSGDNGPANLAQLTNPTSVGLDGLDNLYVIDSGNASLREINYQNPTLPFGVVPVGQTAGPQTTTLWDSGNQDLTPLSNFTPADQVNFAQVFDGCGGTLQQGSTCELSFTFTPSALGNYITTAASNANAADIPQVITLVGSTPQPPSLQAQNVTAVYGTAYSINASITGTSPAPTGTVMFTINGVAICPAAPLPANGAATCSPSPTLENVGVYTVTVSYTGDGNYLPASTTIQLSITPAPVTVRADDVTRPYNTPNPTLTGTITGVVAGQSLVVPGYTTTAVLSSPPGTYPISVTLPITAGPGTLLSNYTITVVNGTLTIPVTGSTGSSFTAPNVTAVYGSAYVLSASITGSPTPAPTGTITFSISGTPICPAANLQPNGTSACSPSPTLENAGSYTVTVVYSGDNTYAPKYTTFTLTIAPAPVTITANDFSRPVNTPNPAFTGVINGVVTGQSITATYATTAVLASPAGTYPIVPTAAAGQGTLLSNYAVTIVNGTLTITSSATAAASVNGPNVTVVYGNIYTLAASITGNQAAAPTGTAVFTIGGATVCPAAPVTGSGVVVCTPSATLENVGTYPVTITYSGDATYAGKTATFALTVLPAPVTITANSYSRVINTPNPTFSGIISGVVAGQSITATYLTTAVQSSPVGIYPIVPTPVAGTGTLITNYTLTVVNGTLTVTTSGSTQASITAPNVSAVYGTPYTVAATILSKQTPAPSGSVAFTINGNALCPSGALPGNGTAACTPSAVLENVGTYLVTAVYSGDSIYSAQTVAFTLTIAPAPLTITADSLTRPLDSPNPTFTGTITGVVSGQSITATYTTTAVQNSPAGTYPIVPAAVAGPSTLLSNYAVILNNGTLTITAVPPPGTGSFTLTASPSEQEIDKTGGVNYTVLLTSVNGFSDTVTFSCSGLPEGGTCSFAPGTILPAPGGTNSTIMTVAATADGTNVPNGSYGMMQAAPVHPGVPAASTWLAWTMLPLGFGGSATTFLLGLRRRRQSGTASRSWMSMLLVPIALLLLGLAGCSPPVNYKIYTITVTATDSTPAIPVVQSTTVQLTLAR